MISPSSWLQVSCRCVSHYIHGDDIEPTLFSFSHFSSNCFWSCWSTGCANSTDSSWLSSLKWIQADNAPSNLIRVSSCSNIANQVPPAALSSYLELRCSLSKLFHQKMSSTFGSMRGCDAPVPSIGILWSPSGQECPQGLDLKRNLKEQGCSQGATTRRVFDINPEEFAVKTPRTRPTTTYIRNLGINMIRLSLCQFLRCCRYCRHCSPSLQGLLVHFL